MENSGVKVQALFYSEPTLSPLPEMRNKSVMSENVTELNKLNIFGETDLLHVPPGKQSHPRIPKATLFRGQFPQFLMGFDFHTLSLLVIQKSFS